MVEHLHGGDGETAADAMERRDLDCCQPVVVMKDNATAHFVQTRKMHLNRRCVALNVELGPDRCEPKFAMGIRLRKRHRTQTFIPVHVNVREGITAQDVETRRLPLDSLNAIQGMQPFKRMHPRKVRELPNKPDETKGSFINTRKKKGSNPYVNAAFDSL